MKPARPGKSTTSRRDFFRWLIVGAGGLLVGSAAAATSLFRRRTEGKGKFVDYTGATLDTIDDGDGGLIQCLR